MGSGERSRYLPLLLLSFLACVEVVIERKPDDESVSTGGSPFGASAPASSSGSDSGSHQSATATTAGAGGSGDGGNGSGGNGDGGSGTEPTPTCSGLTGDTFDPGEVYLHGTLSEGACWLGAFARVCNPWEPVVGFDCYHFEFSDVIRPTDGRLVYTVTSEDVVREFHCDDCPYDPQAEYPPDPLANDALVTAHACDVWGMLVSADGDAIIRCSSGDYYDPSGNLVFPTATSVAPTLLHVGYGGLALTTEEVVDLTTGVTIPITGFPHDDIVAVRAIPDGFFVAVEESIGTSLHILGSDGVVATLAFFAPAPPGASLMLHGAKLDASATLYQFASSPGGFQDLVVRRDIGGSAEIVYDEGADPLVKIHSSTLVTGP